MHDDTPAFINPTCASFSLEEESAWAAAQAATGISQIHKPIPPRVVTAVEQIPIAPAEPPTPVVAEPSPIDQSIKSKERRQRCGECPGCTREDCGVCVSCQSKVKFGGSGTQRKCCIERKCTNMQIASDKRQRVAPLVKTDSPYAAGYVEGANNGSGGAYTPGAVTVAQAQAESPAGVDPSTLPDCNQCRFCLDKKRNGGTGTLRRRCILKGEPERKRSANGGGGSAHGQPRKVSVAPNLASATADPHLNGTIVKYFNALHTCDRGAFDAMWHPEGHLIGLSMHGTIIVRDADDFKESLGERPPSNVEAYTQHDRVLSLSILDGRTATAKVQIALPPAPNSPTPTTLDTLYTDLLVLLRDDVCGWRIISKVYVSTSVLEPFFPAKISPADFGAAASAAWQYIEAARECSSAKIAEIFHSDARLTYASSEGRLEVLEAMDFGERIERRWDLRLHTPYAHLAQDPRVAAADTLLDIAFAGPGAAFAYLKVGFPPNLYTDVLSLMLVRPDATSAPRWMVVAMSCCAVPFMVHDGIPIAEATPAIAEVAAPPAASYHPRSAAVVVEAAPHTYFAEQEAAVAAVEAGNKQSIPLVFSPLWQVPAVEVHSAPLAPVASAVVDTDPAEDPDPD